MESITSLMSKVQEVLVVLSAVDTKLDEVAAYIITLQAGAVDQAQLDQLGALVDEAKGKATAVLGEADTLDGDIPLP